MLQWDTGHVLVCLFTSQDREPVDGGATVKPHLLFSVWKIPPGSGGALIFEQLTLFFNTVPTKKKKNRTCQHLYSCSFRGRELAKSRRALRSPTAHLAPSAFVLGKRQPTQIIKVRILTEVLCSKFSHILGWRTLRAHFPC